MCDHLWTKLGKLSTDAFDELSRLKLAMVKLGDLTGVGTRAGVHTDDSEVLFMGNCTLAGIGKYSASCILSLNAILYHVSLMSCVCFPFQSHLILVVDFTD